MPAASLRPRRPHDPAPEPLAHGAELVRAPAQRLEEHVVPGRALELRGADRAHGRVLRRVDGALGGLDVVAGAGVEAAQVERVPAQEVHGGQVERGGAGGAARRGELGRLGGQVGQLGALRVGVGAEGLDEAPVLRAGGRG